MAGTMRKMGVYLGLLEDGDPYYEGSYDDESAHVSQQQSVQHTSASAGVPEDSRAVSRLDERRRPVSPVSESGPAPSARVASMSRITTLHPRTYNEARVIGENFRDGVPVIMNLSEMSDGDAKRLVDFAAGLVFATRGTIERVTNKVFLLSPPNVSVAAEDKQRIAEGGFFNQS
ncbi:DUF552 domain-containing protein [Nocardioides mangrovicus]|uniref:Cell division protein SepF n=1 Tax=Nocardioides mangrovicus TaxID=2478913 RepID=A0A3L8P3D1_9ACTN|nr:cell division protein SepF [Nocardioides mangrovicus]RLV48968.1 DUF552 domain-containing protein [Nocardioides mangrovicus]